MNVPLIGPVNEWVLAVGVGGAALGIFLAASLLRRKTGPKAPLPADPFALSATLEQRGAHRRKGNPIGIQISDAEAKGEPLHGIVLNRSAGGLGLEVDRPLEVDTIVSIRVVNAPVTVPWIQVHVRSCRQETNGWFIGCQFVKTPPWSIMLLFG